MWFVKSLALVAVFVLSGCSSETEAEAENRERCSYIDYLLESTYENIAGLVSQGYSADDSIRLMKNLEAERIELYCNKYNNKN